MEPRRLTRDSRRAVLGGVAAGIADYLGVDPVLVRIVFIALAVLSGAGIVAYFVGWIIMPRSDEEPARAPAAGGAAAVDRIVDKVREAGDRLADEIHRLPKDAGRGRATTGGIILIVLGALFLLDRLYLWRWPHWVRLANLWPIILIVAGGSLILDAARGRSGGARSGGAGS